MIKNDKNKKVFIEDYTEFNNEVCSWSDLIDYSVEKPPEKTLEHYLPENTVKELKKVFELGAKKYGAQNYLEEYESKDSRQLRIINALYRHFLAVMGSRHPESNLLKKEYDAESGSHHMYHVAACALMFAAIEESEQ